MKGGVLLNWSRAVMKEAEGLGFILSQPITLLPRFHIVLRTFALPSQALPLPRPLSTHNHTISFKIAISLR
jgi:hypothetical protein